MDVQQYQSIGIRRFSDFSWWFMVPEFGKEIGTEKLLWGHDIVT
jgi:hypothetical protein